MIDDLRAFARTPGLSLSDAAAALEALRQVKPATRRSWWQWAKEWVFGKVSEKGEA